MSSTSPVQSGAKMSLSSEQCEGMPVANYPAQFLTLQRFALGIFASEREWTAQFVSSLRVSIQSVVAKFSFSMLAKAVLCYFNVSRKCTRQTCNRVVNEIVLTRI